MPETSLRRALLGDAASIARVHRLSRADYYREPPAEDDDREAMWSHLLGQPDRDTYVADTSGSIVGFMSSRHLLDPPPERELTALYVLPSEFNRGVGSRLYELYVGELTEGTSGILEVWAGNLRAVDFYRRRGWVATSEARPGPQGLDFMTYRLPAEARGPVVLVTRVGPEDWQRLRGVRLAALAESPEMFGSTSAREQSFDEEEWRRRAARPATFVASRDGVDVGTAGVYDLDGEWCVMGMWLAPAARGTGVVEALVSACESVARAAGATTIALGVMEDNPRGRRAYVRLGYQFTGAREHVRDGRDELFMSKALTSALESPLSDA